MWEMIKGYVSIGLAWIVGLISVRLYEIDWNLYQSGRVDGIWSWWAIRVKGIKGVVDLEGGLDSAKVRKYLTWYHHWSIVDGPLPDINELWRVARLIYSNAWLGMKVLVHCAAGVNRSSLMDGCVLFLRGREPKEIVELIRKKRPGALTNKLFEDYLLSLTPEDRVRYGENAKGGART